MDRGAAFVKLARRLDDVTTVRYDRRGYGRSIDAGVCATLDDQIADLCQVIDGERVVLVGHSSGAVIALAAASQLGSQVRGVLAIEPPMPWEPWWPRRTAGGVAAATPDPGDAAEAFMRRIVGDAVWESLPAGTRAQRRAEGPALLADLRMLRRDRAPWDPSRLTMPLVVGYGDATDARHRRAVEVLADAVPGAQVLIVPGAGHNVPTTHPDALVPAVRLLAGLR